jgi:methylated-DNA-[protein]-cysteine S-methyltransferase
MPRESRTAGTVLFHRMASPIGGLLLVSDGHALTGLYMEEHAGGPGIDPEWIPDAAWFEPVCRQLEEYFQGTRVEFDVPLALHGTDFQKQVWSELSRIPFGETVSYGEQARRLGRPAAARAVGRANGQNPISIIVPCHRVIGGNGSLTGYGGGMERKRWLLDHERAPHRGS